MIGIYYVMITHFTALGAGEDRDQSHYHELACNRSVRVSPLQTVWIGWRGDLSFSIENMDHAYFLV